MNFKEGNAYKFNVAKEEKVTSRQSLQKVLSLPVNNCHFQLCNIWVITIDI
jgi:hypothetical protein